MIRYKVTELRIPAPFAGASQRLTGVHASLKERITSIGRWPKPADEVALRLDMAEYLGDLAREARQLEKDVELQVDEAARVHGRDSAEYKELKQRYVSLKNLDLYRYIEGNQEMIIILREKLPDPQVPMDGVREENATRQDDQSLGEYPVFRYPYWRIACSEHMITVPPVDGYRVPFVFSSIEYFWKKRYFIPLFTSKSLATAFRDKYAQGASVFRILDFQELCEAARHWVQGSYGRWDGKDGPMGMFNPPLEGAPERPAVVKFADLIGDRK